MKSTVTIKTAGGTHTADVLFSTFPDGDTHCLLEDTKHIRGNHVIVAHDLYPEQNNRIVQLLLLLDLLEDLGAQSVSLFVPYLPYARQDKRHVPGEAISARSLSKLLHRAGVQALYTFDCHFLKGAPHATYADLEIYNLTLGPALLEHFKKQVGHSNYHVVGPDAGSNYLVKEHGNQHMQKQRGDYATSGSVRERAVQKLEHSGLKLYHDVVAITDDIISTGGTMLRAVQNLQELEKEVYCLAVHGLFLNGSDEALAAQAKGLWVSDTLPHANAIPLVQKAWKNEVLPVWLQCFE